VGYEIANDFFRTVNVPNDKTKTTIFCQKVEA
jgi:hypothetical protein